MNFADQMIGLLKGIHGHGRELFIIRRMMKGQIWMLNLGRACHFSAHRFAKASRLTATTWLPLQSTNSAIWLVQDGPNLTPWDACCPFNRFRLEIVGPRP